MKRNEIIAFQKIIININYSTMFAAMTTKISWAKRKKSSLWGSLTRTSISSTWGRRKICDLTPPSRLSESSSGRRTRKGKPADLPSSKTKGHCQHRTLETSGGSRQKSLNSPKTSKSCDRNPGTWRKVPGGSMLSIVWIIPHRICSMRLQSHLAEISIKSSQNRQNNSWLNVRQSKIYMDNL